MTPPPPSRQRCTRPLRLLPKTWNGPDGLTHQPNGWTVENDESIVVTTSCCGRTFPLANEATDTTDHLPCPGADRDQV